MSVGTYALPARRRRTSIVALASLVAAVLAALCALAFGAVAVPVPDVVRALVGVGDAQSTLIVTTLRLPRVVAGLLIGAALALAGALTQTVARNPLASPDIMGVTSGASVGAVAVVVLTGSAGGVSGRWAAVGVPVAAVAGAFVAAILVGAVARSSERLILVGLGVTAAAQSLVAWLLVMGDVLDAGRAAAWLAGSLNARTWSHALPVLVALALVTIPIVLMSRLLPLLSLGDDAARGLGVSVRRVRFSALAIATVLAGVATAAAGPIAFVGLAAPQLAARMTRSDRPPLAGSALVGAALVAASDLLARNVFAWFGGSVTELPVGIVTAALGAAYLVIILTRKAPAR